MTYAQDNRIVATLDAGGTNFVFSAIQGNKEITEPVRYPAEVNDLEKCLNLIKQGFQEVIDKLPNKPVAISFAFPGPADYARGIIGDLPNFPSFRGGVALGPFLEHAFGIPVYINNDGSLFAYGEALAGALPEINAILKEKGSPKQYTHLYAVTLGTGFGGGAVIDKQLLIGDNGCGGDIWCYRNKKYQQLIAEESVSIRAIQRVYNELSGEKEKGSPKDIYDIAKGLKEGDQKAAIQAFEELGEMAGDAIAHAITNIDGLIVIGGGVSGAAEFIVPAIVKELNSHLGTIGGDSFPRMQVKAYDLVTGDIDSFVKGEVHEVPILGSDETIAYEAEKKTGVMISKLGTSLAVSLGAYAYALNQLDR